MAINESNQPSLPRAITVRSSVSDIKTRRGPLVPHYNFPLDLGRVFRWVPDEITLVADDRTVIEANGQGNAGRWVLVRQPIQGADVADVAAVTISVGQGFWRRVPVLSQNSIITLDDENAEEGDIVTLTRLDVGAFTLQIDNGGATPSTLVTFPVSLAAFGDFYFNGSDWLKMRAATML